MAAARDFWDELFGPETAGQSTLPIPLRLLRKRGQPFLLLPARSRAAAAALELYPAQTGSARLAKTALRWLLRAGARIGTKRLTLALAPQAPFPKFVCARAGLEPTGVPCFGVLAGNPAMASQRFLVLVFNADQRPVAVIKAGLSDSARALVRNEAEFLASAAPKLVGIPRLQDRFQSARVSALALDYYPGRSPRPGEETRLPALLGGWLDTKRTSAVAALHDWLRLDQAAANNAWFTAAAEGLRPRQLHPAIYHGDFAPWNIKVSPEGTWTVLDWERGELAGPPGWDWLHYVLQPALLVERLDTSALVERVERLLASESFKGYAHRAGLTGFERPLVLAYLVHCVEVLRPAEGLSETQALLAALGARWLKA